LKLSLHYRIVPRELSKVLSVAEAIELQVFAKHETLDPVSWEQTAHLIRTILAGIPHEEGAIMPDVDELMPTIPWDED
jgi:hypothetical protein